jgi:hypothetical protein
MGCDAKKESKEYKEKTSTEVGKRPLFVRRRGRHARLGGPLDLKCILFEKIRVFYS